MKLHVLSDLHLEFSEIDSEIGDVASDVVVLAGDKRVVICWTFFMMAVAVSETVFAQCQSMKNQAELSECMGTVSAREDEKLSSATSEYMLTLSTDQRRRFAETQHAWRKFIELSCDFESTGVTGGSVQSTILANCYTRLTRERLGDIEFLRHCARGSHNCPSN